MYTFSALAADVPNGWVRAWPDTDFHKRSIEFSEVLSGGPPKDGIPSIDHPKFIGLSEATHLTANEPVIVVSRGGETKIYPLQVLIWHEIVNDVVGGKPTLVTYCPLCNAAIVFDARIKGQSLTFGTTGKLRKSDLIMYDRETQSWWQQFMGEGVVGHMTGQLLTMLPARLESFAIAAKTHPHAKVLVPNNPNMRKYGQNPYLGYDTSRRPFLFDGELPTDILPMMRVVVVDGRAWSLPYLRKKGRIEWHDLTLQWSSGQSSALDLRTISHGRDVGNIVVQRQTSSGPVDVVHHITFAFVFYAFHPNGELVSENLKL
ncbi:MAG: DUF3179 domain-containing protein [Magnetovibrio sp.]|nr:DUF3179 domain-containing protein [Magnetovibrio sp.]